MEKIDFKKSLKELYQVSSKKVVQLEIPTMNFLKVNGSGSPEHQSYQDAIETLYGVAYTLKFMIKKSDLQIDYGVLPLEGLWWVDDMSNFSIDDKDSWHWTAMIMQPDFITPTLVSQALDILVAKKSVKKNVLKTLAKLNFEEYLEGTVAQILHIGPFTDEGPTIEKVHDYIAQNQAQRVGKHHEIYLSDIRRAAPDKWKTIIRQPMA